MIDALRLNHFSVTSVYDDLDDVIGEHPLSEPSDVVAERLAKVLDHALVRIETPKLSARCPPDAIDRARRARVRMPSDGVQPSVGDVRVLALAVLELLDLVGDVL
ncbi:hypothetical protein [Streptomyces jumonjinensis]|uniref:Uncharacterized protein n=1 Tax=Streptomyces jumonjinensis TaxID=1945 RepID=A0A646KRW6_STRJU|nr:hypothetical protein [Streptomyces jumonjinensis]MQT05079.1 hypothetical protein [Streptomyces jumonjinensis]